MFQHTKGKQNVGTLYTQSVLSGYSHLLQSSNTDGNSTPDEQRGEASPQELKREQKAYKVFVPFVVEKVGGDSDKLTYSIHLNGNTHLLVSPYSIRGKTASQDGVTVPFKEDEKTVKVRLDYGVHQTGKYPLSHPDGHSPIIQIAHITGFVLDAINATIERTILKPTQEEAILDARECAESASTSTDVGTHKAKRRGKKVHPKVHAETLPKVPPQLDETNGSVLGDGYRDSENRLVEVDDYPYNRDRLEGDPLGF